jgi:hypothetical protein
MKPAINHVFRTLGGVFLAAVTVTAAGKGLTQDAAFAKTVQPFLSSYCVGCHNGKVKTANLDLQQFTSVDAVRANLKTWKKVAWKLELGEMPPEKSPHPKPTVHKAVLKWVKTELAATK